MSETSTLISNSGKITREELAQVPTPPGTTTHRPVPHHEIVKALVETLSFRHIGIVGEEYAVSGDGMRMFGVLDLEAAFEGCRFAIALRNSHDKSFRLSCTVGVRVFVCENLAFSGDFTPVLAKHSKHFSLQDSLAVGSIVCNGASSRCADRWKLGASSSSRRPRRSWSSIELLSKVSWTPHATWLGPCTNFISIPGSTSSSHEPCGAFQTPSHRLSSNSTRSPNLRQLPSWVPS